MIRAAVRKSVQSITDAETLFQFGVALSALIPGVDLVVTGVLAAGAALFQYTSAGRVSAFNTAASDDGYWEAVACNILTALGTDAYVTDVNAAAVIAAIGATPYSDGDVMFAVGEYAASLGASGLEGLQEQGALLAADCSFCDDWCVLIDFATGPHGWGAYPSDTGAVYDGSAHHWFGTDPGVGLFVCDIVNTGFAATYDYIEVAGVMGATNNAGGVQVGPEDYSVVKTYGHAIPPGPYSIIIPIGGLHWTGLAVGIYSVNNVGLAMTITSIRLHGTGTAPLSTDNIPCP